MMTLLLERLVANESIEQFADHIMQLRAEFIELIETRAMGRELHKAQRYIDGVCNTQDNAIAAFEAETQRMKQEYIETLFLADYASLTEAERQLREIAKGPFWLDGNCGTVSELSPAQQAALQYGDAVDLDEWQNDWKNTYNDLRQF